MSESQKLPINFFWRVVRGGEDVVLPFQFMVCFPDILANEKFASILELRLRAGAGLELGTGSRSVCVSSGCSLMMRWTVRK